MNTRIIEAEASDTFLNDLQAEFPELQLQSRYGQTLMPHHPRNYHRRILGPPADIQRVSDRLSMSGLTWQCIR